MALKFYNSGQEGIADDIRRALLAAGEQMGGRDFGITSGYRSPEHNKRVGGAKSSYHTRGEAVDIDMKGMSEAQRAQLVQLLAQQGVGGFITYSNSPDMLHIDMRKTGTGKPHFMHDRSAQFLNRAPGWFQQLATGKIETPSAAPAAPTSTGLGELLAGKTPGEYLMDKQKASALPVQPVESQVVTPTARPAMMNASPVAKQAFDFTPPPAADKMSPATAAAMFAVDPSPGATPFAPTGGGENMMLAGLLSGLTDGLTQKIENTTMEAPEQKPVDVSTMMPEFRQVTPSIEAPQLAAPADTAGSLAEVFQKLQSQPRPTGSMFRPSRLA
ncbi:hypothetical protein AVM02_02420 [Brucella anthropi]|uniref:YcbK family protein n=1 Tax=Brucella anthropi TaxID=529 RepID=UPI00398646BA